MKKENQYRKIVIKLHPDGKNYEIGMYLSKNKKEDMKLYRRLLSMTANSGRQIGRETIYHLYRNQGLVIRGFHNDSVLVGRIKEISERMYGKRDRGKYGDVCRRMLLEETGIDSRATRKVTVQ